MLVSESEIATGDVLVADGVDYGLVVRAHDRSYVVHWSDGSAGEYSRSELGHCRIYSPDGWRVRVRRLGLERALEDVE